MTDQQTQSDIINDKIPNGWVETTLGEILSLWEFSIKNSFRLPLASDIRAKRKGIYPYYWAASAIDHIDDYKLEWFHLLIAEDGTVTSNWISPMLQLVDGKFNVSNHAHILQGNEKWQTKFLFYVLSNININPYITGAVQPKLNKENLLNIVFLLPSDKKEQNIITWILSSFDEKIELLREENKTLEQTAQTIFQEWFMINDDLQKQRLGDLVEVKRGWSPRPIQDYISETGLRWLKISDASATESPYIFEIKEHIIKEGLSKTTLLKKWALVLSNSATPWIPKILAVDSCIHDGWLHFPKSKFSNEFLYLLFQEIRPQLIQQGSGSVFTNLKTDILKDFEAPLPDDNLLDKFDKIVKPIFEKIFDNASQIQSLSQTRDELLPRLMKGEVRVEF